MKKRYIAWAVLDIALHTIMILLGLNLYLVVFFDTEAVLSWPATLILLVIGFYLDRRVFKV